MAGFPDWIEPMAATLTQERFAGPEWLFEQKLDGIRLIAFKHGKEVRIYSRNHLPQEVPEVSAALAALPVKNAVLDGELLWDRSAYHVFDLLWLDGRDLRELPLIERLALLKKLPFSAPLHHVRELKADEPWAHAAGKGWEGVIAKRRNSTYQSRRSPDWLKMKVEANQELVVGGFTDPQGKRAGLGALLVGYYEGAELVFAGKVGTSLPVARLLDLRARLDRIERKTSPFDRAVGLPRLGAHWVTPELVVQVAFMEWTRHGKLRHPRLVGERVDKQAREVVRE